MADASRRTPEIKVAAKTDLLRSRARRRAAGVSGEVRKKQPLPLVKLVALAGCVSLLAALFLAAIPTFQPEILAFQTRVGIFVVRYTMPICYFQLGAFWILYRIRKR
jgi:hypothetical protein